MSRTHLILLVAALTGLALPVLARRRARAERNAIARAEAWPGFVDSVASSLLAGLTIHESLQGAIALAETPLRLALEEFRQEIEKRPLTQSLMKLARGVATPASDEFALILRINLNLGGSGLVKLLQEHSTRARNQNAVQAQLRTKVSATLAMAKLAVIAPWALLALLVARPETSRAFDTSVGVAILLFGLVICVLAYQLVGALGRGPVPRRIYVAS